VEELIRENKEKEQKYLDLYMENSQQHEKIIELQKIIDNSQVRVCNDEVERSGQ